MNADRQLPDRKQPIHLENVRRHNEPEIIFLTVCTKDRKPVLANPEMHDLLVRSWKRTRQWIVGRYIVMPDHVHLFCSPRIEDAENVKCWVTYWKRLVSRETPQHRPLWQRDCWDTQLRSVRHYDDKWDYVVMNSVRKELVRDAADWPYQGELHKLCW